MLQVIVFGLGSMGKRRIRLIKEMYKDYIIYGIDTRKDRCEEVNGKLGINCYTDITEIDKIQETRCAFVCTSPLSHSSIITQCLNNRWNVFTELNLVDNGYESNINLAEKNNCILFLSSTFLYRSEISYIRKKICGNIKWNYIYHTGQYLPDWHPWENYNDFFVGNKQTNGCREIMAIELPWLVTTFGEISSYNVISDKITSLNIDYNDNYFIQFVHKNGNKGIFVVDVVSPSAVRKLEVYSENRYLSWEGTPDSIKEYNTKINCLENVFPVAKETHIDGYSDFIIESAYKNEIKEFFDIVSGKKEIIYGFKQDMKILQLIDILENYK